MSGRGKKQRSSAKAVDEPEPIIPEEEEEDQTNVDDLETAFNQEADATLEKIQEEEEGGEDVEEEFVEDDGATDSKKSKGKKRPLVNAAVSTSKKVVKGVKDVVSSVGTRVTRSSKKQVRSLGLTDRIKKLGHLPSADELILAVADQVGEKIVDSKIGTQDYHPSSKLQDIASTLQVTKSQYPALAGEPLFLFCDGTGNAYEDDAPTNIMALHTLMTVTYPEWASNMFYFRGVGYGPVDYMIAFTLPGKIAEIYEQACKAFQQGSDISIFGFSRGALTARIMASLFYRFGVIKVTGKSISNRYKDIVENFFAGDKTVTLKRGETQIQNVNLRFLGIYDTVPGTTTESEESMAYWLRDFPSLKQSCHIQATKTTVVFESRSLHSVPGVMMNKNFPATNNGRDLYDAVLGRIRAATDPHLEFLQLGEHANIGGGFEAFNKRRTDRYTSNMTFRYLLAGSPFAHLLEKVDAANIFPVPLTADDVTADCGDRLNLKKAKEGGKSAVLMALGYNFIEVLYWKDKHAMTDLNGQVLVSKGKRPSIKSFVL